MTKFRLLFALASIIFSTACGAAGFPFKQDKPSTGSAFRFEIGQSSFPLAKGYAQLSREELQKFKSEFWSLAIEDEPPAPSTPMRDLVSFASDLRFKLLDDAHVKVVVIVNRDGRAQYLRTEATNNLELEKEVLRILLATKFKPALCSGELCDKEFPFEIVLERVGAMSR